MSFEEKIKKYDPKDIPDELIDEIVEKKDWNSLGFLLKRYRDKLKQIKPSYYI